MFHELPLGMVRVATPAQQMPEMPIAAIEAPSPPPSPEQARVAEIVFSAQERESQTVQGVLGMWTGVLLLHDLAIEHFSKPVAQEEDAKKNLEVRRRIEPV
jgi:hypothetical protein